MTTPAPSRRRAFSLVEMLLAVAITGVLGLAVVTALDASFMAYGTSTESASQHTAARLVSQKAMAMIRTASLHDAYDPASPGQTLLIPSHPNHPLRTVGIQMQQPDGQIARIWWADDNPSDNLHVGTLWISVGGGKAQRLIERVEAQATSANQPYVFTLASRTSDDGLLLERATLDLAMLRDTAALTDYETATGRVGGYRLVASTVPRKNLD